MSDYRKKPLWPWIVTLLIGLPVLYVAAYGPVCWLRGHGFVSLGPVCRLYRPFAIITLEHPRGRLRDSLKWYEAFCTGSHGVLCTMEFYEEHSRPVRKGSDWS